jgi:ferredoxin-NADP reductase
VSNHLNDQLRQGSELKVLGPSGAFVCQPSPEGARHLVLIAAGSGITPLMSIASAVLAREPGSIVSLVYGNRTVRDIIFLHDLEVLAAAHPERFRLALVLEHADETWAGTRGRLDRATLATRLDAMPSALPAEYYVCGPEPVMQAARAELQARGVAAADVHEERFSRPELRSQVSRVRAAQPVAVTVGGRTTELVARADQTILEAGLEAGLPLPFSCAMGGCGACKVTLTAGVVDMEEPACLTPTERADGWVLACVSRAETPIAITVPAPPRGGVG